MTANFADESNWLSLYDNLTMGAVGTPIAPIVLASSLSYRFLRVTANNQNAKSSWRWGGYCFLMVDEPNPQVEVSRLYLSVNKPIILPVPDYLASYRFAFTPPKWFDEISLQVDGYIGAL